MGLWSMVLPSAKPGTYGIRNDQGQIVWVDTHEKARRVFLEMELEHRAKSTAGQGMEYNGCPWCGGIHPNCKTKNKE